MSFYDTTLETALDAVILQRVLREYDEGRNPRIPTTWNHPVLAALGRPLSPPIARDLLAQDAKSLCGRKTIDLVALVKAADDYIARQLTRPNLKALALVNARAARRPRVKKAG